jgi:hypothetical protein
MLLLNSRDVRKCRNSLELNEFIEKYAAEGNPSKESFDSIYWNLFEEWKRALKTKPPHKSQPMR